MVSEDFKQYLSGFFDGDGCIAVEKQNGGYTLRIKFSQSNQEFVNAIKRHYPFLNKTNTSQRRDNSRIEFELRASGIQIKPLVQDLLKYSILKYEQLLEANRFFELIGVQNKSTEKEAIYLKLRELKKKSVLKPYDRLNKIYIAGLADAEGCITATSNSNAITFGIVQKSDTRILEKIAEMYNNTNKISNYTIYFHGTNCKPILTDIQPFCIYKAPQIKSALDFIQTINCKDEESKTTRLRSIQIISDEKHVDYNKNDIQFKSQEHHKIYIIECINKFKEMSYNDSLIYCKMKEIEEMKVVTKIENRIFNLKSWAEFDINPVLEFCENSNQLQMYNYYRKKVSSLPSNKVMGKAIRILVKDSKSDKYIGMMCLSSDVINLGERDSYIGWDKETKEQQLNKNLMNLTCCVPLQPFGFNTTGGKLLASLAFSKEVYDYYLKKYNEPLLAIITTSINGKSIQYDRLECMKLIGYTKGFGSVNIPKELFDVCKEYNDIWKVIPKDSRPDKMSFFKYLLKHLNLSQNILFHNHKRGIYFGYLFKSKMDIIQGFDLDELKTVNQIYLKWKMRWCDNRLANLISRNMIKTTLDLYTPDNFTDCVKYILPTHDTTFTDQLIKEVLTYKSQIFTREEICEKLNKKYNINLNKNNISQIFTGKILPKIQDQEYHNLIELKVSRKKVTDEEIYFILDNLEDKMILEKFNSKFNKKISKATISDIRNNKLKPYFERKRPILKEKTQLKPEDRFNLLSDEQLIQIMKMKSQKLTTQDVSDFIKENFHIIINRNFISKLFNGEVDLPENILNSDDYKMMIANTKQRTVKAKKFTEEEIDWIKINNTELSLGERCRLFEKKFNKTITKTYLSKLLV
jgi:hypothetical protein